MGVGNYAKGFGNDGLLENKICENVLHNDITMMNEIFAMTVMALVHSNLRIIYTYTNTLKIATVVVGFTIFLI